jgi:hypothetical protein
MCVLIVYDGMEHLTFPVGVIAGPVLAACLFCTLFLALVGDDELSATGGPLVRSWIPHPQLALDQAATRPEPGERNQAVQGARTTQRNPMWPVEVSIASPWRAAGR